MKVSIIGGGGRVGSDAAFALQLGGVVREIVLVDANADMAAGEALDLRHGASLVGGQFFRSGDYDMVAGSDCVVITAGLRRQPDESRLDLINRNLGLFSQILDSLKGAKLPSHATILVVSNPVDILTQTAVGAGILPEHQVIGLGTVLDTARFRSLLADNLGVNALDVKALVLGEHGDTMVPIWSSATIGGVPMGSIPGWTDQRGFDIFAATKTSGAEVIRQKGGAGRAVGVSIKEVVEAIALDSGRVLPISAMQKGALGVKDVCYSMPTVVGRLGAVSIYEPKVSDGEREALLNSAKALNEMWAQVQGAVPA
ncbi:MAG: lactate/malate dehydrogenase family protein [Fimbriimonadaceae bacterium]|nr:lactate/malate dehydrogenase family protein [Fimbriimonadaceae bacterium]QYK56378.1 MAG: lactate/malate dehydrogenase family protein [Fimbriimonadaceae bacterium]